MGCSCPSALFLACWPAAGGLGRTGKPWGMGQSQGEGAWVLNDRVEQSLACQAALGCSVKTLNHTVSATEAWGHVF